VFSCLVLYHIAYHLWWDRTRLSLRIKSLEDPGTAGGLSVDELLLQLRSDLTEAESGLEEAREAELPLAAKHLERTITDLKMRIAALEETI